MINIWHKSNTATEINFLMSRFRFVDLFVRVSNSVAITMYENLGYTVYRKVLQYYSGDKDEDAYDMRKALSRDTNKTSVIPLEKDVHIDELEY